MLHRVAGERLVGPGRDGRTDLFEQVGEAGGAVGLFQPVARDARFGIESDAGDARAVLPPVVLFLQHQGKFLEPVIGGSVFALEILHSAAEAEQSYRTLMFDLIRHGRSFILFFADSELIAESAANRCAPRSVQKPSRSRQWFVPPENGKGNGACQ